MVFVGTNKRPGAAGGDVAEELAKKEYPRYERDKNTHGGGGG
jgi:hypothetical protein